MLHTPRVSLLAALLVTGGWLLGSAHAQVLSSPVPSGSSATHAAGVPATGQGAGVHSPLSPFAPLPKRSDVVA